MSYPTPPRPVVLSIGKALVCCDPVPPYPGRFIGHPDGWEPPEPGDLGPIYMLARSASRSRPDRWLRLDLDHAEHLKDKIWDRLYAQGEIGNEI